MEVLNSTLSELEGDRLSKTNLKSGLVERYSEASKKKLKNLSPEDIRMLLGQKVGLPYIVPIALSFLEENPLCSGTLYCGDLLAALLDVPDEFWSKNPELNNRLIEIRDLVNEVYSTIGDELLPKMEKFNYI